MAIVNSKLIPFMISKGLAVTW